VLVKVLWAASPPLQNVAFEGISRLAAGAEADLSTTSKLSCLKDLHGMHTGEAALQAVLKSQLGSWK
jgi:hypothetical protein